MTKTNELATTSTPTFSVMLTDRLDSVAAALPEDFHKTRFVNNAIALLNDNPEIAKFGKPQIMAGLMKGAFLGLDFMSKECYLIPYGNQLQYQTSYTGDVKLAIKYSTKPIKKIESAIVREGDEFTTWTENGVTKYSYKPITFNNKSIIGAFAACIYEDGDQIVEMMSVEDLENTRSASKAKNSPAWTRFTSEMYRKTVLRRLCKRIPIEFRSAEQVKAFDAGMEIETNTAELVKQEIEVEANVVDFEEDGGQELSLHELSEQDG